MLWFWLFGDVSRSLSIAVLIAFPTAWLLGRWLLLPLTIVFLVAQAAYCYMAEALDDGVYGVAVGALALWWWMSHGFTTGSPWESSLAAASAYSAAFLGWRRYRRTRRPLLDEERD